MARKAGLDSALPRAFLRHLPGYLKSEAEVAMLAHLADALGDTQMSVRVGKAAVARGMNLAYYAYPVQALPQYTPLRKPPEPAVILGIARQESEFNTSTLSGPALAASCKSCRSPRTTSAGTTRSSATFPG